VFSRLHFFFLSYNVIDDFISVDTEQKCWMNYIARKSIPSSFFCVASA